MNRYQLQKQFCLLPCRIPSTNSKPLENIKSIAEITDGLVLADDDRLFFFQVSNTNPNQLTISDIKLVKIEDYSIDKIECSNNIVLFHYIKSDHSHGPLYSIVKGQNTPTKVADEVTSFSISNPGCPGPESRLTIAAVVKNMTTIYQYMPEIENGKKWHKLKQDELIKNQPIYSIALMYPYVILLSSSCIIKLNFEYIKTNSHPVISYPISCFPESYVMDVSPTQAFIYVSDEAFISGIKQLDVPISGKEKFNTPQTAHTKANNNYVSISQNTVTIYNLNDENKLNSTVRFPGAKNVCTLQNKNVIVTNNTSIFLVTECSEAYNRIMAGDLNQALASLKNPDVDILCGIFEQLWQSDYKQRALAMLRYKEIYPALKEIVSLFKMVKLTVVDPKKPQFIFISEPTEDQKLVKMLIEHLQQIRGANNSQAISMITDTALFEIYSYQEDVANLSSFISEHPDFHDDSIKLFFGDTQNVSLAMYLAYHGEFDESMNIFKSLQRYDKAILDEIARQIICNSNNWSFCEANVTWLFDISPLHACKVLTSETVNSKKALDFTQSHFPKYYNIILHGILDHKDVLNRAELVNDYAEQIFQLLFNINSENFDREKVAFCTCVIENKTDQPTPIKDIEQELGDDFIDVLRRFPKEININNPAYQNNEISSNPRVQVEIYRASGNVEKALELIWKNTENEQKEPEIDSLEEFCKQSENPSDAFQILIKLMKEKLPAEKVMNWLMKLLSRNMSMIDIPLALANIDQEQNLVDVAGFLEDTYRTLVTMRKDAELDAAFAVSNEFESEYSKVKFESQVIELNSDIVCTKCKKPLGYQYVLRAPNGMLYHYRCMQSDKRDDSV